MYVVVLLGDALTVDPDVALSRVDGLQVYEDAPDALISVLWYLQISVVGVTVMVGRENRVMPMGEDSTGQKPSSALTL